MFPIVGFIAAPGALAALHLASRGERRSHMPAGPGSGVTSDLTRRRILLYSRSRLVAWRRRLVSREQVEKHHAEQQQPAGENLPEEERIALQEGRGLAAEKPRIRTAQPG